MGVNISLTNTSESVSVMPDNCPQWLGNNVTEWIFYTKSPNGVTYDIVKNTNYTSLQTTYNFGGSSYFKSDNTIDVTNFTAIHMLFEMIPDKKVADSTWASCALHDASGQYKVYPDYIVGYGGVDVPLQWVEKDITAKTGNWALGAMISTGGTTNRLNVYAVYFS